MAAGTAATSTARRWGLTARGWTFLALGLATALVGMVRGLVPVVQFGVLIAALPLVAAALTRPPRRQVSVSRALSARELPTGGQLRVIVAVRTRFGIGRSLLLEDLAPEALGGPHRFALSGLSGDAVGQPHYQLRTRARGSHLLGPLRLHVVDRFGMVHRVQTVGGRDEVVVVPPVVALAPLVLGGAAIGVGAGHVGALGAASDDVIPRTYHAGDEVRRIDWKASARTGELMVRSEESPWRPAVTVLVDVREGVHAGDGPDSSMDLTLSVAASVGALALATGYDLAVRTTDDQPVFTGSPVAGISEERRALLRALAVLPASTSPIPATSLAHSADVVSSGPMVLVTGDLSQTAARILAGVGGHSPTKVLVRVDTAGWHGAGPDPRPAGLRDGAAGLALMAEAGWRATSVGRGEDLAAAWSRLAVRR